jgi:death on curing protein
VSLPNNWKWLRADVLTAIHEAQLVEHGGMPGVRSPELLDSALARPQTTAAYADEADAILIGATYAIAIARNHPFIDGNKRVAWVAMRTFLQLNGIKLTFERSEAVSDMLALAAGERTDEQFTDWVCMRSVVAVPRLRSG